MLASTAAPRLAMARSLAPLVAPWLLAAGVLLGSLPASADQGSLPNPQEQRPQGLVLLRQWQTMEGVHAIGVYGAKVDPADPAARTIGVWLEAPTGVKVGAETLRCSPAAPMRLTRQGRALLIKELNPGGLVSDANRLDHQIWWAACFPEHAGKDPATLAAIARQLGYSGQLREQEQVLPGNPR